MFTPRLRRLLWLAALVLWLAVWLFPISTRLTRSAGVVLFAAVWIGLIALVWKHGPWRVALLALSAAVTIFLLCPDRNSPEPEILRAAYLRGMNRYGGARYFWGGESPKGIDCSGLMRRMI